MAKLVLTTSEFADFVAAFLFDTMLHPDELIVENEKFNDLMKKISKMGAKPYFMKYYLDMSADNRLNYKRFKPTLEPGATTKSVVEVNPSDVKKAPKKKGKLTKIAKSVVKKLLLQQEVSQEEVDILNEVLEDDE